MKTLLAIAVLLAGCSPAATTVKCGPGTENLNGQCLPSCADGERREGEQCVSSCAEGESWVDGQCRTAVAAFMKQFGDLADELCACKGDNDCAEAVTRKAEDLQEPPGSMTENDRAALEGIKQRVESCTPEGKVLAEFAVIKDEMCECKDKVCAESVNKKFDDWLRANESAKGSLGQQQRAKEIAEEYTKCMMAAMAGDSGQ